MCDVRVSPNSVPRPARGRGSADLPADPSIAAPGRAAVAGASSLPSASAGGGAGCSRPQLPRCSAGDIAPALSLLLPALQATRAKAGRRARTEKRLLWSMGLRTRPLGGPYTASVLRVG